MRHYKTIDELKKDLDKHGNLTMPGEDVKVDFDIPKGVVRDVECNDFHGHDFHGGDFHGLDFHGHDFIGRSFHGDHISYYAMFVCYRSCSCLSHKSRRQNALPIQCLDGKLTVREPEPEKHTITLADGRQVEISAENYAELAKAAK